MNINTLGITGLFGSIIVVGVNLLLHQKNRKYDQAKEQLIHLYNPLNALIKKKQKALFFLKLNENKREEFEKEYYQFFMEIQEIYLTNEVYASLELNTAFRTLHNNHELEYYNYAQKFENKDDILKEIAKFELRHSVDEDSKFEQKMNKFIEVVNSDIYQIYHQKPVERFFRDRIFLKAPNS